MLHFIRYNQILWRKLYSIRFKCYELAFEAEDIIDINSWKTCSKNTFLVQSQEQFFFHLRSVGKHISGIGQGHYASVFDVGERCDKMELSNILTETHTETLV